MGHLGDKLKEYRTKKNWKQPQMAEYLQIGNRTYQSIEKTGIVKKAEDLERITKKTGLSDTQKNAPQRSEDLIEIKVDRDLLAAEMQKDIIRINAKVNVVLITLADIVSKVDKKAIAIVDGELTEAINREAEHLLSELSKRFPLKA
jgi:transcriptional regulator with XRE-family HTH domain